ncbi:MAG: DUF3429 family protein [Gammaproteobacteria bacterium]|nr:DUF3429 family protein [Gammaproteobacteria bacterium]
MSNDKQLQDWIDSAPIVIFRSPITEMDLIRREFNDRNLAFREIELSMADSTDRDLFHHLKKYTNYHKLPQIFIDRKFIGGADKTLHSDLYNSLFCDTSSVNNYKNLVLSLGYAGIIPFIAFTFLAFFTEFHSWAIKANLAYGAIILTFLGAIYWGRLLNLDSNNSSEHRKTTLIVSIIPSIIAWLVLIDFLKNPLSLCILILSFIGIYGFERHLKPSNFLWYEKMRTQLSYSVIGLLSLSLLSILVEV